MAASVLVHVLLFPCPGDRKDEQLTRVGYGDGEDGSKAEDGRELHVDGVEM